MNAQVRPWRPVSQLDLERIRDAAVDAFDAWLSRWIARLPAGTVEAAYVDASVAKADALGWRVGSGIRMAASESVLGKAALLALDVASAELTKDAEEVRVVIEALRTNMADDLVASIAAAYAESATERLSGRGQDDQPETLILQVRRSGTSIELALHIDQDWISSTPLGTAPAMSLPSLETRATALQDSRIAVAATLGHCRLTVAELAQLAVGDIVTCDTHVDAAVDLALLSPSGHSGPLLARAKLGRAGERWALLVSDIESQKVGNER